MSQIAILQNGSNVSTPFIKWYLPVLSQKQPIQHKYNKLKLKNEHHEKTSTQFSRSAANKTRPALGSY
jgi:hypothetical protein